MSALKVLAMEVAPKLLSIGGANLKSSDPYSIDVEFVKSIFNKELASQMPAPRLILDPLGYWRNVSQYPITTGSSGNCIVTICPHSALYIAPTYGNSQLWYPYVSTNPISTSLVYNGATYFNGPFIAVQGNTVGWLPDCVKTYFQCTQSILNASGRIFCGVYYQSPNKTFDANATGAIDASVTNITASQIENSTRANKVIQVASTVQQRRLTGRWIPNGTDYSRDLYQGNFAQG